MLGRGKTLEQEDGEKKTAAIMRIYAQAPLDFCRYCLEDARLVLDILEKTGLLVLTLRRCTLIGVDLNRAWTSIAAFEHLYIEALHGRGAVAPSLGVDTQPLGRAPGGAIITPRPGLHDNVFVFDFKSLYPSIIRTFNIDPLSRVPPQAQPGLSPGELAGLLEAPNGALFRREPAILPKLLDRFTQNREAAKRAGDEVASYVYKIIMNSFYGVLGASGCRFAADELAGAITSFGHHVLHWCEQLLVREGYQVLYGDTDSLFVLSLADPGTPAAEITARGLDICRRVNCALDEYITETYRVESRLELELEKTYARFFLPHVRGVQGSGEAGKMARGRAKGYAGALLASGEPNVHATPAGQTPELEVEVTGMEAVRRDWTALAREFQVRLLHMVFAGTGVDDTRKYIAAVVNELKAGALDDKLVYIKALRKPTEAYQRSRPPHVKAAMLLDPEDRRGLIRFFWTTQGPQPQGRLTAPIDYEHYVQKQLKPIASGFSEILETDAERLFDPDKQLWLFGQ